MHVSSPPKGIRAERANEESGMIHLDSFCSPRTLPTADRPATPTVDSCNMIPNDSGVLHFCPKIGETEAKEVSNLDLKQRVGFTLDEARTVEQLWRAIASFLKGVSKEECKAYLANSGYT
jgi:hypothetical protein